jgi:hypothetical protein
MSIARPAVGVITCMLITAFSPFSRQSFLLGPIAFCLLKTLITTLTGDDMYELFGRYGSIRQIRMGNEPKTKGTAFVVYDDVMDVRGIIHLEIITQVADIFFSGQKCS